MDFFSNTFSQIGSFILEKLNEFVGMLLFRLSSWALWLLQICEKLFNVFSGTTEVQYLDKPEYLVNVFFKNSTINKIYWAMALLGIIFVVAFSILAVGRKMFDIHDTQKQTMGGILGSAFKGILAIVSLSFIMSAALTISNGLIVTVTDIFNNADSFSHVYPMSFSNEQYATMARIYKTIGNYSLNPSYASPYNLNSCFNDIREDLQYLEQQNVFDVVYPDPSVEKGTKEKPVTWNWQNVLEKIVYAADLSREAKIDSENEELFQALQLAMQQCRTNSKFYPIDHYVLDYSATGDNISIANVIFLSGTATAARNPNYNRDPFMTDGLRGAYFRNQKDITDYDTVKRDFVTGLVGGINYIMILLLTYFTFKSLFQCIVACVSRIINMIGLYIIAPIVVSTMPSDDGAKFKQWTISMVVQMLSIFGYIIPMRLMILFVPIIMGDSLKLFPDSVLMDYVGKAFLVVGSVFAVQEFSQIINGILADMAGHASLHSGEAVQKSANDLAGTLGGAGWTVAKFGAKNVGAPVLGGVLGAGGTAVVGTAKGVGKAVKKGWNWAKDKFSGSPSAKGTPDAMKNGGSDHQDGGPGNQGGNPSNQGGSFEKDNQGGLSQNSSSQSNSGNSQMPKNHANGVGGHDSGNPGGMGGGEQGGSGNGMNFGGQQGQGNVPGSQPKNFQDMPGGGSQNMPSGGMGSQNVPSGGMGGQEKSGPQPGQFNAPGPSKNPPPMPINYNNK